MKRLFMLAVMVASLFVYSPLANAKWWIFGQGSADAVSIDYLNLNNVPYIDMTNGATFFTDALDDGLIVMRGKARTSKGRIGSVQVSLDDQQTWKKARLSKDGAFEFTFIPLVDSEYHVFVKAMDTAGKTNEVEDTGMEFTVVEGNSNKEAEKALAELFRNYETENLRGFSALISEDFVAGSDILESAVRGDFLALDFINVRYWINSAILAGNGDAIITFRFDRSVIGTNSGRTFTDKGLSQVTMRNENGKYKLYAMKQPLMFGLSDAEEVATGEIRQSGNEGNLVIAGRDVMVGKVGEDVELGEVYTARLTNWECIDFATQQVFPSHASPTSYWVLFEHNMFFTNYSPLIKSITLPGSCNIESDPIPTSGYSMDSPNIRVGGCYAFEHPNGDRVLVQVTSYSHGNYVSLKYRYERN